MSDDDRPTHDRADAAVILADVVMQVWARHLAQRRGTLWHGTLSPREAEAMAEAVITALEDQGWLLCRVLPRGRGGGSGLNA